MRLRKLRPIILLISILAAGLNGCDLLRAAESANRMYPKARFEVQKVGSRYEPVTGYYDAFRLPGTSMRFGAYICFSSIDDELGVPKWGFLLDNGRFFYLKEPFASNSDPHYAIAGNYFIVDGGAGGSGVCRSMHLFEYGKGSMRLLDTIEETYSGLSAPSFMSDYPGKPDYGHEIATGHHDVPVWTVKEKDRHGHPLIRLKMVRDVPLIAAVPEEFDTFHIYLKIDHGKLRVAFDPDLYAPLFEGLGEAGGPKSRSTEYYVAGLLAGRISLARITAELAGNAERLWLLDSLSTLKNWDRDLHKRDGRAIPRFHEYKPKRR